VVHLHSFGPISLVATPSPLSAPLSAHREPNATRRARKGQRTASQIGERPFQLIQGSLSAKKVERQSPLLASLHRVSTGALIGLGFSLVGLSALTLHWQNHWAKNYAQLEAAKVLEHRLHESAAVLEQHHIRAMRRPGTLLPTSSENLIHLPEPKAATPAKSSLPLLVGLALDRSSHGKAVPSLPAGY